MDDKLNLPLILNGEFFQIVSRPQADAEVDSRENSRSVTAKCMLCMPKKTTLSSTSTSTGNFYKHLRRKHPAALKKLDSLKLSKESALKLKRSNTTTSASSSPKKSKPATTPFTGCKVSNISVDTVNELTCNYLIEEMLPIYCVEKQSFRQLIYGLTGGTNPSCRKTIMTKIYLRKEETIKNLKLTLQGIPYICTTADIWTANNKSFFGVTCHYLDSKLERKSAVLACRRIKFSHTYFEIGKLLSDIHKEYHLTQTQLVGTVTDNASNFGKAFRIYTLPENSNEYYKDVDFLNDENVDITIHDIPDFADLIHDIEVQIEQEVEDYEIKLPRHYRCASHTLNLIATTDCEAALQNPGFKKMYNSTFAKLTALWNYSHRSTAASDQIESICGMKLLVPCPTRWNSLFNSVQRVLHLKDHLSIICDKLEKPRLKSVEVEFLSEYVLVMKPLAQSIDILQGEEDCFLGYVLPTLFQVKTALNALTDLSYCTPLKEAIIGGIDKRYKDILDLDMKKSTSRPYILATVAVPKFKLRWINVIDSNESTDACDLIKSLFVSECERIYKSDLKCSSISQSPSSDDSGDLEMQETFFTILKSPDAENKAGCSKTAKNLNVVQMECLKYFEDRSRDVKSLLNYNIVLKVFKLYNTILPSSGPVERLFSAGGQILTPKRNRLSDEAFETLLMLKKNK